jgi:hypothetical protein
LPQTTFAFLAGFGDESRVGQLWRTFNRLYWNKNRDSIGFSCPVFDDAQPLLIESSTFVV